MYYIPRASGLVGGKRCHGSGFSFNLHYTLQTVYAKLYNNKIYISVTGWLKYYIPANYAFSPNQLLYTCITLSHIYGFYRFKNVCYHNIKTAFKNSNHAIIVNRFCTYVITFISRLKQQSIYLS